MSVDATVKTRKLQSQRRTWFGWLAASVAVLVARGAESAPQIMIWDTGVPFADTVTADNRASWRAVPSELFVFELDPGKAASDPGYYGREYAFKGDAVVENRLLTAVFWSAQGRVVIYSKPTPFGGGGAAVDTAELGSKVLEFTPLRDPALVGPISRCGIVRNEGDEAVMEVTFGSVPGDEVSVVCSFDKTAIFQIKPAASAAGIRLFSGVAYGVVPGFVGDDLIFSPPAGAKAGGLVLPVENVFMGLLEGEGSQWVMTWPKGGQRLTWHADRAEGGHEGSGSMDFENDGRSVYLAALSAAGIWHRETLTPSYLEKDVISAWRRPFPARWKTQLSEAGVRTSFTFRESKGAIWRGVPGSYTYPVWFDEGRATYHCSKKVLPKGESIVYFMEGHRTPAAISTPVDVIKATLGRPLADTILDVPGRKLRTHHRRGDDNVRRACTCGCTEAIQAVFEAGQEVAARDTVKEALEDMNFFVERHMERIDEYRRFAADLIAFLQTRAKAEPELRAWCEALEQTVQRIPEEYRVQRENMKSLDYARELTRQTLALTTRTSAENLPAYLKLLDAWRAMGGAQDYVLALCHTMTRELHQQAGYGCVDSSRAVALGREVRARCRQVLRNPDGYEIWADY